MAVTNCNIDMEALITDQNRSIATLAITTLLKTGVCVCVSMSGQTPAKNPAAWSSLKLLLPLLLLPAGNEGSVDKLLKQIGGFMSDIAGVCSSRLRVRIAQPSPVPLCACATGFTGLDVRPLLCRPTPSPCPAPFWALGRYPPRRLSCAASLAAQPASCVDLLLPCTPKPYTQSLNSQTPPPPPPSAPQQQMTSRWWWLRPSARCA